MSKLGGSRFGWSYVQAASDCPTKWYLRNLAPWPGSVVQVDPTTRALSISRDSGTPPISGPSRPPIGGGVPDLPISGTDGLPISGAQGDSPSLPIGLEAKRFSAPLDVGSRVHLGLEAWYLSGVQGGHDTQVRDLEMALAAVAKDFPTDPTEPEVEALSLAQRLVRDYVTFYGNDPGVEVVVFPDGQPAVEAELWLDLGWGGTEGQPGQPGQPNYQFTSRLDLIYKRDGYLWALEHKTTAASAYGKLLSRFTLDGQVTGQFLQLASHFPNEPIGGVTLNALVKDRSVKSGLPAFSRRDYARTPAQLEKFRLDITRKLHTINLWVEEWLELVAKGMSPEDAALAVFDGTPNGTQCVGMGFSCDFLSICQNREVASRLLLDNFEPREYRDSWSNPLRTSLSASIETNKDET